jgi:hypothetical protein
MSIISNGEAKGHITLESFTSIGAQEVLRFHPEIQAQLNEIEKQGWKYLYVMIVGKAVAELSLENSVYRINARGRPGSDWREPPETILELMIGKALPAITTVSDIREFRINVCSKSIPRAATVDLAKGVVTYIGDSFWKWEKGWENDKKKLSDAREVLEIATWLLDVKKYGLIEVFKPERYQELSVLFKEISV